MIQILKNSTGYKRLDVYVLMNIIQLETLGPGAVPLAPAEVKGTIHEPEDGDIPF